MNLLQMWKNQLNNQENPNMDLSIARRFFIFLIFTVQGDTG